MNDKLREALEDAKQLRWFASSLTYNDTTAEGEAKHRLHEIAMRIESGYYQREALAASKQEPQLLQKSFDELAAERRASKTEPQAQAGEPDERLCKFYGVTTYADLVAAQARHIEKLQSKLEPVDGKQPGKARFA